MPVAPSKPNSSSGAERRFGFALTVGSLLGTRAARLVGDGDLWRRGDRVRTGVGVGVGSRGGLGARRARAALRLAPLAPRVAGAVHEPDDGVGQAARGHAVGPGSAAEAEAEQRRDRRAAAAAARPELDARRDVRAREPRHRAVQRLPDARAAVDGLRRLVRAEPAQRRHARHERQVEREAAAARVDQLAHRAPAGAAVAQVRSQRHDVGGVRAHPG